jgi:peptide/nickel transport system permease protein
MTRFILLRLLHTILILFGVSIVAFGLIHLIPGNPLDILLPPEAPKEVVERLKVEFGFDKPLYVQYLAWVGRVVNGNLGTSVFTGLPVTGELLNALGNTFVLAVPAALLGFSLGTTFGTLAAFNNGRLLDKLFSVVTISASACRITGSASRWSSSLPCCGRSCRRPAWPAAVESRRAGRSCATWSCRRSPCR